MFEPQNIRMVQECPQKCLQSIRRISLFFNISHKVSKDPQSIRTVEKMSPINALSICTFCIYTLCIYTSQKNCNIDKFVPNFAQLWKMII